MIRTCDSPESPVFIRTPAVLGRSLSSLDSNPILLAVTGPYPLGLVGQFRLQLLPVRHLASGLRAADMLIPRRR